MFLININDNEKTRFVDRIRAITFYQAKQNGADFITKRWVVEKLGRSEEFVKRMWKMDKMKKENIGRGGNRIIEHGKSRKIG